MSRFVRVCLALTLFLLFVGLLARFRRRAPEPASQTPAQAAASFVLKRAPFADGSVDEPRPGVIHWTAQENLATTLDLIRFDFGVNPRLRLELFDQDEQDRDPFDNRVHFWRLGVGRAVKLLTRRGHGPVIAAWNGSFFSPRKHGGELVGRHIAPVVLDGVVHYPEVNHRWTVGVRYENRGPVFTVLHLPDRSALERQFTFAVGGVQCLIRQGAPLRLFHPSLRQDPPLPRPVPSTPAEAGAIPGSDFVPASRTSMGWTTDPLWLYVLIVKAVNPGRRPRRRAYNRPRPFVGGWTLRELQRFWQSLHVIAAVNLDGGDVTQMICRRRDGRWDLVPARWATPVPRTILPPRYDNTPGGGSLMYFYVREVEGGRPSLPD